MRRLSTGTIILGLLLFFYGCQKRRCNATLITEEREGGFEFYDTGSHWIYYDTVNKVYDTLECYEKSIQRFEEKDCQHSSLEIAKFRFKNNSVNTIEYNIKIKSELNPYRECYFINDNKIDFSKPMEEVKLNDTSFQSICFGDTICWSQKIGFVKLFKKTKKYSLINKNIIR